MSAAAGTGKEREKETKLGIEAKKEGDFSSWYTQVCLWGWDLA